jgi:hypothetical protein
MLPRTGEPRVRNYLKAKLILSQLGADKPQIPHFTLSLRTPLHEAFVT